MGVLATIPLPSASCRTPSSNAGASEPFFPPSFARNGLSISVLAHRIHGPADPLRECLVAGCNRVALSGATFHQNVCERVPGLRVRPRNLRTGHTPLLGEVEEPLVLPLAFFIDELILELPESVESRPRDIQPQGFQLEIDRRRTFLLLKFE